MSAGGRVRNKATPETETAGRTVGRRTAVLLCELALTLLTIISFISRCLMCLAIVELEDRIWP